MSKLSIKNHSRLDFTLKENDDANTPENITLGCMLRIADATEAMAKNFLQLQSDVKYYKENRDFWKEKALELTRSNASLKGHITRLKNNKK